MTLSTLTRRMLQQFCTSAGVGKSIADKLDAGDTDSLTDYERRRLAFAMGSQAAANALADCLSSGDDLPDWVRRKLVFVGGQFAGDEIGDAVDAVSSEVLLLSSTSSVGGAYGIIRLVAGYNGYAVTIKRSSDNTSQDFGFKSNGELDDAAKTFVSGTVGYITKFYDQSGNANHITGSTLSELATFENTGIYPGGSILLGGNLISSFIRNYTGSINGRDFSFGRFGFENNVCSTAINGYLGLNSVAKCNLYYESGVAKVYDSATGARAGNIGLGSNIDCTFWEGNGSNLLHSTQDGTDSLTVLPASTYTDFAFGTGYAGGTGPYSVLVGFAFWTAAVGSTERAAIRTRIREKYTLPTSFTGRNWLFVGDSLTAGAGSDGRSYPYQLINSYPNPNTIRWANWGSPGATSSAIAVSSFSKRYGAGYSQNICVIMGGINDIRTGTGASTVLTNLQTAINNAVAAGFTTYICTIPQATGGGMNPTRETERQTVNSGIPSLTGHSGVIDASAAMSTSNWVDNLHFNTAGYGQLAAAAKAIIN